jgi:hypothetical protein
MLSELFGLNQIPVLPTETDKILLGKIFIVPVLPTAV